MDIIVEILDTLSAPTIYSISSKIQHRKSMDLMYDRKLILE